MPAWYLNPALTRFRNEVNARWPNRDKASDGTIGDLAHQATSSDHNPDPDGSVDAWDMDNNGLDVNAVIAAAIKHESIAYIIYNRRITSRNQAGGLGTWHPYSGASPHTEHVHFNTRESHENSTKPWFTTTTPEVNVAEFTQAQIDTLMSQVGSVFWSVGRQANKMDQSGPQATLYTFNEWSVWMNANGAKITAMLTALGSINEVDTSALEAQLTEIQGDLEDKLATIRTEAAAAATADESRDAALPSAVLSALATQEPDSLLDALEEAMTPAAFQALILEAANR